MKEYTRSALGKQEGVDPLGLLKQEIFLTAYSKSIASPKAKASFRNIPPIHRNKLAPLTICARESNEITAHAAHVTLSLLSVNGGDI
jgi:hypothetical protein